MSIRKSASYIFFLQLMIAIRIYKNFRVKCFFLYWFSLKKNFILEKISTSMTFLSNSSLSKILLLLILFSTLKINEGRFVWDFGSYCLNYCAKMKHKSHAVNICSCQWISSYHRRSTTDDLTNSNYDQPFKIKTFFVKWNY